MLFPVKIPRPPAAGSGNPVTQWDTMWGRVPWHDDFMLPNGAALAAPWEQITVGTGGADWVQQYLGIQNGWWQQSLGQNVEAQQLALRFDTDLVTAYASAKRAIAFKFRWAHVFDLNGGSGTLAAGHRFMVGVGSEYNANLDAITCYARFAANGTNDLLIQSDDNVAGPYSTDTGINIDPLDVFTGTIVFDLASGQVHYFLSIDDDGDGVDPPPTYLGSHTYAWASPAVEPILALQRTGGGTVDQLTADYVTICARV